MTVKIKKINEMATFTKNPQDVGYDLTCTRIEHGDSERLYILYLGVATEIPKNQYFIVTPRSSFTKYPFVMNNSPGIIDPGYRGEWQMRIWHLLDSPSISWMEKTFLGKRIAQATLRKKESTLIEFVENLSDSDRGVGGFGSTGV